MGRGRLSLARLIHRRGAWFDGVVRPPDGAAGAGATDHERRATVRISTTFGWPRPLPDWAGLAVRIFDRDGAGHVDLLLVSSVAGPELWRQMRPNRDVLACTFTSAMRYRLGRAGHVVVAVPVAERSASLDALVAGDVRCPIVYQLRAAETERDWRPLGELELTTPVAADPALRFQPPDGGDGWLYALRRAIYRALQGGR